MNLPFESIKRKLLTKRDSELREYKEKSIEELLNNGVICLNKPEGPTSHQVADYIKQILNLKKAGHGGTLDPHVTGVLPIALEKATRIVQTLLPAGKEYICLMYIHSLLPQSQIHQVLKSFEGKVTQLPPVRSAVKRQEREREVYYIDIIEIKEQYVLFKVGCQGGFYVRRLCDDFGKITKVGAHMAQLVRTKAGPFNDNEWYSLHDLKDAIEDNKEKIRQIIKPIEYAVQHLPKIYVQDNAIKTLTHGADLHVPGIVKLESDIKVEELVAIMSLDQELVCIGNAKMSSEDILKSEKGLAVKTSKVFMEVKE